MLEPDLVHNVTNNWGYCPTNNIVAKIGYCIEDLKSWNKDNLPLHL